MKYDNIKLWFAKNEYGDIVTINEISNNDKYAKFRCPICDSIVIPKAINSNKVTSHFSHMDTSKCNSETMIHWWFKHKLLVIGDTFKILTDKVNTYVCAKLHIEKSIETSFGKYRPDVIVETTCGEIVYFEMAFTNMKKVRDYLNKWIELGNIVVEIQLKDMLLENSIPTFHSLFHKNKCFNMRKNDPYYNSIGKHKEELLQISKDEISNDFLERFNKLDWLWDSVLRYKKGNIDIESISKIIDSIEYRDQDIAIKVIKKTTCNNLYKNYRKYKMLDEPFIQNCSDLIEPVIAIENILKNKIKKFYEDIDVSVKIKSCTKSESYYHGSRKYKYKYRSVFSHYEFYFELKLYNRIIKKVTVTNRMIENYKGYTQSLPVEIINEIKKRRIKFYCKTCSRGFYLTLSEINYFKTRKLSTPKRCISCRMKRKLNSIEL